MSTSMSQSVLMALTVTLNKYTSSSVHAVHKREGGGGAGRPTPGGFRRRNALLLSTMVAAFPVTDSKTELLQRYLKKSEENKTKNDKERMDSYNKRNYKDYFDFVEGSLQGKKVEDLTEAEKGIIEWLKNNK